MTAHIVRAVVPSEREKGLTLPAALPPSLQSPWAKA